MCVTAVPAEIRLCTKGTIWFLFLSIGFRHCNLPDGLDWPSQCDRNSRAGLQSPFFSIHCFHWCLRGALIHRYSVVQTWGLKIVIAIIVTTAGATFRRLQEWRVSLGMDVTAEDVCMCYNAICSINYLSYCWRSLARESLSILSHRAAIVLHSYSYLRISSLTLLSTPKSIAG